MKIHASKHWIGITYVSIWLSHTTSFHHFAIEKILRNFSVLFSFFFFLSSFVLYKYTYQFIRLTLESFIFCVFVSVIHLNFDVRIVLILAIVCLWHFGRAYSKLSAILINTSSLSSMQESLHIWIQSNWFSILNFFSCGKRLLFIIAKCMRNSKQESENRDVHENGRMRISL